VTLGRAPTVLAFAAHLLAWGAFLWAAFWPFAYQGVSATPVQVDELGDPVGAVESELVRHSASFLEVNGVWGLVPLLIPVVLTGLALLGLGTWRGRTSGIISVLWVLTAGLLTFCLLTSLSVGVFYVPAALVLIAASAVLTSRHRLPRVPQE